MAVALGWSGTKSYTVPVVRTARPGWCEYYVRTVLLPCASGTYSTQEAGTRQHRAVLSCLSLTCSRRKAGAPSSGDKAASTGDVGVPAGGGGAREASSKGSSIRTR